MIHKTLQSVNSPDINLERDIVPPEIEAEIALGAESAREQAFKTSKSSKDKRFKVNITTIIISALIFLAILAWFDFIQTAFYVWLSPDSQQDLISPSIKLWYAILITVIIIILIVLIYYHSHYHIR